MTGIAEVTVPAFTAKLADVEPFGTLTDEGTLNAAALEVVNEIVTPMLPAGPVKLTVPVPDCPPTIVAGLIVILLSVTGGGVTVIPTVALTPM